MLTRFALCLSIAAGSVLVQPARATVRDTTTVDSLPPAISALIARFHRDSQARSSLTIQVDSTRGSTRDFLEEQLRQKTGEIHATLLALAEAISQEQERGDDPARERRAVRDAFQAEWPSYIAQLERRVRALASLSRSSDLVSGAERVAIESEIRQQSESILAAFEALVDGVLALERMHVDLSEQRAFLVGRLPPTADGMVTRVQLATRARSAAVARLSRDAANAELRYNLEAEEERLKRANQSLSTAILLMDRLGLETTRHRVALIAANGKITADIFKGQVFLGLLRTWWARVVDFLAGKAPQWLFQGLLIALTFFGFRALSHLVQSAIRMAVKRSRFSVLLRSTIVALAGYGVMVIGFVVILAQFGVQVAPMLAGLGIAGVVIGFAMQNTLSNFAAGGMILSNQPFDVGDDIEVAGVSGTVKRMSLVCTTILTADNETLVIPNSSVWGGVIRNRTAQANRRVDLSFGIGYGDDIEKAERVLHEIVAAQKHVQAHPEPVVRLHQLADSSVNFVVRVWTTKEYYWDVYWDLTRMVKVRFDQEGISIPFPQREVHLHLGAGAGAVTDGIANPVPTRES